MLQERSAAARGTIDEDFARREVLAVKQAVMTTHLSETQRAIDSLLKPKLGQHSN